MYLAYKISHALGYPTCQPEIASTSPLTYYSAATLALTVISQDSLGYATVKNNSKSQWLKTKKCYFLLLLHVHQGLVGALISWLPLGASLVHYPLLGTLQTWIQVERKRALKGLSQVVITHLCQRMSPVTSHNSLAKSRLMAPPSHKETRKCNPICLKGRELDVFGDQP